MMKKVAELGKHTVFKVVCEVPATYFHLSTQELPILRELISFEGGSQKFIQSE